MIDEAQTFKKFGYYLTELSKGSGKKVIAICQKCGENREVIFQQYRDLCRSCAAKNKPIMSEKTKKKISKIHKGKKVTKETCKKLSDAHKGKISGMRGKKHTLETKIIISCGKQYIDRDKWGGFAKESPYCEKFNELCKESNREKYNRRCFICNKPESENITSTGKLRKLSVHHVDMNKQQGCNSDWKLVPLCQLCHLKCHNDLWQSRIEYLLKLENLQSDKYE